MILLRWFLNAIALLLVANLLPGFHVDSFFAALIAALLLGLANVAVKPLFILLTLPINILTLGLFTFVINALMLELVSAIVKGFTISTFGTALIGALILWLIGMGVNALLANGKDAPIIVE
jgi:putative membrane protein